MPHHLMSLLKKRRALIVGDAIESRVSLLNALDLRANGMSRVESVVANATKLS